MDSERGWTLLFWSMIVLGVLAVLFRSGNIEQDLTERANAVLHENGLQWASVKEASGRNLVLTGEAPVQDFRNLPEKMVAGLYGVRGVDDEGVSVKDPVSPYIWQAVIAEDLVTLKGSVPDNKTRSLIVKKAMQLIYDRPVIDKMILADGSPDSGWLDNISSVLKYTKYLKNGVISLEDRSVKVEGEAWNLLDHEIITLRTGRGKASDDYKFSSNLLLPGEAAKRQEISNAETAKTVKSEQPGPQDVTEKIPAATKDTSAVEKEEPAAVAPLADTPEAPLADTPPEGPEGPEGKAVAEEGGENDAAATDAASVASGNDAVAEPSVAAEKKILSETGNDAQPVELPPAEGASPSDKAADKAVGKTGGDKNRNTSAGYYYVPGPYGAPVAVPLNVPPFMVAPPWAFSPYRARPAYPPGCAYLHPGHPAYCGR